MRFASRKDTESALDAEALSLSRPTIAAEKAEPDATPATIEPSAFGLNRRDQLVAVTVALATIFVCGFVFLNRQNSGTSQSTADLPSVRWRVDINSASVTELTVLKGVGPQMAARIVADRKEHGPFHSIADLVRVHGFGPRTIAKNRHRLEARQPDSIPPRKDSAVTAE